MRYTETHVLHVVPLIEFDLSRIGGKNGPMLLTFKDDDIDAMRPKPYVVCKFDCCIILLENSESLLIYEGPKIPFYVECFFGKPLLSCIYFPDELFQTV